MGDTTPGRDGIRKLLIRILGFVTLRGCCTLDMDELVIRNEEKEWEQEWQPEPQQGEEEEAGQRKGRPDDDPSDE